MRAAAAIAALLAGCSIGGIDAPAPMASGRRDGGAAGMEVRWQLRTADLQDGRNNGFEARCAAADKSGPCAGRGVWCGTVDEGRHPRCAPAPARLDFYVQSAKRKGAIATTTIACPAGRSNGSVTLALPDGPGPFLVWAGTGAPDPAHASSAWIDPFDRTSDVEVTLFACGCDWPPSGAGATCGAPPAK